MDPQIPATPPPPVSQKKSRKWPWIAGGGCLTLLIIGVAIGFYFLFRLTSDPGHDKRISTNFTPYKGALGDLLLPQLGTEASMITYKLAAKKDITTAAKKSHETVVEATAFEYEETAGTKDMKLTFKIQGQVANFSSPADASTWIEQMASELGATTQPKGKGIRFTGKKNGNTYVGWTDGSVACLAHTTNSKPAEDFEKACAF